MLPLLFSAAGASRFRGPSALVVAASVGAVTGLVAWFYPIAVGGGQPLAETVLTGKIAPVAIPIAFVTRFALTLASYGTGAPGGIFSPLLVLGALIGLAVGQLAHRLAPAIAPRAEIFAVVGMAAYSRLSCARR